MIKKLWEKLQAIVAGTDTMDEETFHGQHKLLIDLDTRLKGVEDYLSTTPNHIGQRYIPAAIAVADVVDPILERNPSQTNPDGSLSDGMS